MKFSFEVGEPVEHQVEFSFNQLIGTVAIRVDGKVVLQDLRILSFSLVKRYEFNAGKHPVRIEKERKLLFAGFRPNKYRAFIDGRLVLEREGF